MMERREMKRKEKNKDDDFECPFDKMKRNMKKKENEKMEDGNRMRVRDRSVPEGFWGI